MMKKSPRIKVGINRPNTLIRCDMAFNSLLLLRPSWTRYAFVFPRVRAINYPSCDFS